MKVYALYIRDEGVKEFGLFEDEFYAVGAAEDKPESVLLLKMSATQKELWKYIIQIGYLEEDVKIVEIEIDAVV